MSSGNSAETLLDLKEEIAQWAFRDAKGPRKSAIMRDILQRQRMRRQSHFYDAGDYADKSRFDLPVEYFQDEIAQWLKAVPELGSSSDDKSCCFLNGRKESIVDESVLTNKETIRDSRFQYLNPDILIKALEQRPKFKFIANVALDILLYEVIKKLKTIFDSNGCSVMQDTPHGLFNWTMDRFDERREISNTIWMDVLEKHGKPCLEKQKLRTDLFELAKFLRLVFFAVTNEECLFDFDHDVMRHLQNAVEYLSFRTTLSQELTANREEFRTLFYKTTQIESRILKRSMTELAPQRVKEEILDMEVYFPIVKRYITNYYQTEADDREMKITREQKKLEDEINEIVEEIEEESGIMHASLNIYYTQIDKYKSLMNQLSMDHERRFEELDNQVNYKKLTMVKLENQHKYLIDQMQRFRTEIEEFRQKEIAEREEQERLLTLKAEEASMKLKKSAKGKKKGHKNGVKNNLKKK